MTPALHCSICNGEQIAGFQELATGKFQEVMLIRDSRDLERFCEEYGIEGEIEKILLRRKTDGIVRAGGSASQFSGR